MKNDKLCSFLYFIVILFILCACSNEQSRWDEAAQKDSVASYEDYMTRYPDGQFYMQAQNRIMELQFEQAKNANTITAYESFISEYPNSDLKDIAQRQISALYQKRATENQVVIQIPIRNASDTLGSISLFEMDDGYVLYSIERPGDSLFFSLGGPSGGLGFGFGSASIGTAEGSELRFSGNHETNDVIITSETDQRVCFRKTKNGWAYICGAGTLKYKNEEKTIDLAKHFTMASCIALLDAEDPVLRESAVRSLGQIPNDSNALDQIVPNIMAMLEDPSPFVRRGAAESLGLINDTRCISTLQKYFDTEKDEVTREYIAEAMALYGGRAFIEESPSPAIPIGLASSYYVDGITKWGNDILSKQIAANPEPMVNVLKERLKSSDPSIRLAAVKLIGVAKPSETKKLLLEVIKKDTDAKVKNAALEIVEKL